VRHSGQNIKKHVIKSVTDLVGHVNSNNAFSKLVTSISADCAYNNNYLDDIIDVQRIRCFAHRLNTLGKTLPFIVSSEDQSVDARDIDDEENEGRENEGIKSKKQTAKDFAIYVSCVVKLMNRLRKAPKGNKKLRAVLFKYQRSKPSKPGTYSRSKGPIQGAATRWTYGPKYLRRALQLIDDMSAVFKDTKLAGELVVVGNDDYTADMHQEVVAEFTECQNKRSILGYFMELFQRMEFWLLLTEGTSSPTSSIVLHALEDIEGLIDVLLDQLRTSDANLDDIDFHKQFYPVPIKVFEEFKINFSNIFKDDMNVKRSKGYNFQFFANNPVLKAAKLLDIRFCYNFIYKNGKLKPKLPKPEEFQVIFEMYQSHRHNKSVVTEAKSDDNDVDRYESEGSSGLDDEVTNRGEHEVDRDKILFDDEVKRYRNAIEQLVKENGKTDENYDYVKIMNFKPLEFWIENKTIYPALSTVARGILAVPAQSASSERVFSKMTSIISSSVTHCLSDGFGAM
jgi:hypothetical protein